MTDDNGNKEKARDHPLYKILYRQPNPEMTSFVFWETLMTHLLLWGNAYAQIVRDGKNTVLGLYPLLPENVEVDRDESGELYYIYHAYTDEVPGEQNKDLYFRRDEIFHVPGLGFNGLIGFSPIAMMKNSLGTSIAVDKYGSSFFKNGAQPSGVLEHPGVVKDPNRIRDSWEAAYGGASNAHRVAVLEEGLSYKPISLPPEDSQFLETKQFSVTEICRIFRVPPHLVADLSRATFSNIEYQSLNFVMHSLTPWLVRIEQGIIKDLLLEEEQDTYFPKFNVDGLLRGDYQSRMNGYATGISNGFLKIDAIAASAASVVAMAGDTVQMSPVAMLMIHDPSTVAMGNTKDMEKAIEVLTEVKESIINAYAAKSGLSHARIANLMSNETWMNAKKAVELGFADEILFEKKEEEPDSDPADPENPEEDPNSEPGEGEEKKPFQKDTAGHLFSSRQMDLIVLNRLGVKPEQTEPKAKEPEKTPPTEPPANPGPVLDMDGKTEDGSIPYNILMKQLECMK